MSEKRLAVIGKIGPAFASGSRQTAVRASALGGVPLIVGAEIQHHDARKQYAAVVTRDAVIPVLRRSQIAEAYLPDWNAGVRTARGNHLNGMFGYLVEDEDRY